MGPAPTITKELSRVTARMCLSRAVSYLLSCKVSNSAPKVARETKRAQGRPVQGADASCTGLGSAEWCPNDGVATSLKFAYGSVDHLLSTMR